MSKDVFFLRKWTAISKIYILQSIRVVLSRMAPPPQRHLWEVTVPIDPPFPPLSAVDCQQYLLVVDRLELIKSELTLVCWLAHFVPSTKRSASQVRNPNCHLELRSPREAANGLFLLHSVALAASSIGAEFYFFQKSKTLFSSWKSIFENSK
jgi:hypothetical protein